MALAQAVTATPGSLPKSLTQSQPDPSANGQATTVKLSHLRGQLSEDSVYRIWEILATEQMEEDDHWGYPIPLVKMAQALHCPLEELLSFLNQSSLDHLKWIPSPYQQPGVIDVGSITFHSPGILSSSDFAVIVEEKRTTQEHSEPYPLPQELVEAETDPVVPKPTDERPPEAPSDQTADLEADPPTPDPVSPVETLGNYDYDIYDYDLSRLPNTQPSEPLTQRQLSEITGIPTATLHIHKTQSDFAEWIRQRSPQGFVYRYCESEQLFYPVESI